MLFYNEVMASFCGDFRELHFREIINRTKPSKSSCPLDQISIIALKRCPYLRCQLTRAIDNIWVSKKIPVAWKKAPTSLIRKEGPTDDPVNFRTVALQPIWFKVFALILHFCLFKFVRNSQFIECSTQKGLASKMQEPLSIQNC